MQSLTYVFASLFALVSAVNCLAQSPRSNNLDAMRNLSALPSGFEENLGQFEMASYFVSRSPGYDVYLQRDGLVLAFHRSGSRQEKPEIVRIGFTGASTEVLPRGADLLPGVTHYYVGNDPAKWKTGVRRFSQIRYAGIYPGTDLLFYRRGQQLEFDYDLAPGTQSSNLGLTIEGATATLHQGNLELKTPSGNVALLKRPDLYQPASGKRRHISGGYLFQNPRQVAFRVGKYDKRLPLVIDPALVYSTLVGAAILDMVPFAIAVDSTGAAYVTGQSQSPNPEPSAFVMKLDPTGSTLIYLTHLSGNNSIFRSISTSAAGFAIAVDTGNNAYVAGLTVEPDFPATSGAFATTHLCASGGQNLGCYEAFASKLDATGKLVYSTFLAQAATLDTAGPMPSSVAVDSSGALYVAGATFQQPLPLCNGCIPLTVAGLTTTPGAFQTTRKNDTSGFVLKLHPDGSKVDYSTYLGGSTGETGGGIAVDSTGSAYVDGGTSSADFPTTAGAFQTTNTGTNAFFSKLKADGSGLLYSTFLSGPNGQAEATSLALDSGNATYLAGITDATIPARTFGNSQEPAFVAKFDASGSNVYSKVLGQDMSYGFNLFAGAPPASSIAADNTGAAYVALGFGGFFHSTIVVIKVDTSGLPVYTAGVGPIAPTNSWFGGMAMDSQQNFYVAGVAGSLTDSAGPPPPIIIPDIGTTAGSFQPLPLPADNTPGGPQEIAFVQKFAQSLGKGVPIPNPRLVTFFTAIQPGKQSSPRTVTLFNYGDADLTLNSVSLGGANSSDFAISNNQCGATLSAGANCTLLVTFSPSVSQGTRTATVDFNFGGGVASQSTVLSGNAGIPAFQATPNPLDFGTVVVGSRGGPTNLTIMNTGTAPLNLLAVPAILGANSGDFSICVLAVGHCGPFNLPPSIAPGGQISIPVAFLPSATGSRTAQIVFQTDAPGSPQTVQLTGHGADSTVPFTIVSQTGAVLVVAGQTATFNLSITTGSNISGTITVSCSGAPAAASCTASPSSYNGVPLTTQNVQMTVTTTARSTALPIRPLPNSWWLLPTVVAGFMLLWFARFSRRLRLVAASALFATMLSCGGGSSGGGGGGGGGSGGTPAGTYTLNITVAGSGASASMPMTLTVQ